MHNCCISLPLTTWYATANSHQQLSHDRSAAYSLQTPASEESKALNCGNTLLGQADVLRVPWRQTTLQALRPGAKPCASELDFA